MRFTTDKGAHIIMRPFQPSEMDQVSRLISSYHVARTLVLPSAQTVEQELAWLEQASSTTNSSHWAICWAKSVADTVGSPIGTLGLRDIKNGRGNAGVVLFDKSAWQQGIASAVARAGCYYGARVLDLRAIDAGAMHTNTGSIRAQLGAGFVRVGMQYGQFRLDGEPAHLLMTMWVNPTEYAWNYFWGNNRPPQQFLEGRKRGLAALEWANEHVTLL